MSVEWSYYNTPEIDAVNEKYLPVEGEGETMATQICTAINKLVYKWYNDGDVFDNTHSLSGWCNDLSSYANWLYWYVPTTAVILRKIETCYTDGDYEDLLKELADECLTMKCLDVYKDVKKQGSIYSCGGPFVFADDSWDEDNWDDYEDEIIHYEEDEDD